MSGGRIYVGNLPLDVRKGDLLDKFERYGRIEDVNIKAGQRPPAFAFIEFEDGRDAMDAVRGEDGRDFLGERIRVEPSRGGKDRRGGGGGGGGGGGKRTEFKVSVSGLHSSVSWQDLKDFLRRGGDVVHTNVNRDGTGMGEFSSYDEMKRAVRKLDDTEFRGTYVRLREARRSGSRSRSPPRRGHRSRSRSPPRRRGGRSRSRDRDRRSRSRSPRNRSPSPNRGDDKREERREDGNDRSPPPSGRGD